MCHREVTALQREQRKTESGVGLPSTESTAEDLGMKQRRQGKDQILVANAIAPQALDAVDREWARLGLGVPARRALLSAGLRTVSDLTAVNERQLLALHGFGPSSLPKVRAALASAGLSLAP